MKDRDQRDATLRPCLFPVAAIAFAIVYAKWRSVLAAGIFAMGLFLVSPLSNIRFFREIKRRENMKKDANTPG
jgi:hypothetical protein